MFGIPKTKMKINKFEDPTYYMCYKCGFYHYNSENCMLTKKQADEIRDKLHKMEK